MNKQRRKALGEIGDEVEALSLRLEDLRDEEQEYLDNMPESLQQGEKGELAEQAIDAMDSALSALDEAVSSISEAEEG